MSILIQIILASWLAGLATLVGGLLAKTFGSPRTKLQHEIIHGVIAMGGGILVAAVSFALIPEGIERLGSAMLILTFLGSGLCFCYFDIKMNQSGGSKAQFMAMLVDFIPEAISLGAVFSQNRSLGFLLAAFIGAQNLPEGFNSYREKVSAGSKPRQVLVTLLIVSFFGPAAAAAGYLFLQNQPTTASLMTFASGGILYLIFQDIAPQAKLRHHWLPPLGAVIGFLIGALGKQQIG